jgi:uncharacterized damage-inducible protein DinB
MSDGEASISFREMFAYSDYLAQRWVKYFHEHPAALEVEVGGKTGKLKSLVAHIFDVESYFAGYLLGENRGRPQQQEEDRSLDKLMQLHGEAHEKLSRYSETADKAQLESKHTFGPVTVSNRKILAQAALHSVHHWAQVAMEVRQAGFPAEKPQDIIISDVME